MRNFDEIDDGENSYDESPILLIKYFSPVSLLYIFLTDIIPSSFY